MNVSVIIPIYNVNKYIDRGLKNILSQTYSDYEVILVDDNSKDNSLEICKKWEHIDKRIKVLHQSNTGAGGARNLGIEHASGEYIYFFDIDDELSPKTLEYNVYIMEKYKVDYILFGYKTIDILNKTENIIDFPETIIDSNKSLRDIFIEQFILKINGFPWNKFYRKSFLNKYNIRYENLRIQQDEVFNLNLYKYLEKAYISQKVLYKYYIYNKGNTRSNFISDRFDIYMSVRRHFESLINFWSLNDNNILTDYLNKRFYNNILQCLFFNMFHKNCSWSNNQRAYEINRILKEKWTNDALEYSKLHYNNIEHRIYRNAIYSRKIWKLKIVYYIHSFFKYIYHILKNTK